MITGHSTWSGTKVWVDGELVGQTPLENVPTAIGIDEVIAQHPDLKIWNEQVLAWHRHHRGSHA